MEGKAKPSKGRRGKVKAPGTAQHGEVATLPEWFHSGESDGEEFWGFPVDFAGQTVDRGYSIHYTTPSTAHALFKQDSDEEFKGFTRFQV